MTARHLHVIHLLIRRWQSDGVVFLLCPHDKWLDENGQPYLTLPTKRSVADPLAPFIQGTSLDEYVDHVAQEDLGLHEHEYVLESELESASLELASPTQHVTTQYTIYPVDVWVDPSQRDDLQMRTNGQWLSLDASLAHPQLSPTARAVFTTLRDRHANYLATAPENPHDRLQAEVLSRLFAMPADRPSMDGLATKWLRKNRNGVRHLAKQDLDNILTAGNRAFNLRVADPYLKYQMQGLGFTWSFFTHKDAQDCHVHGAPIVEIYGILEGRMEIWWKPYYDLGTSAWNHRILEPGDWLEVDSLQCHIVQWLTEGKGVVFKAGRYENYKP